MSPKKSVKFLMVGLALVVMLSLLVLGCAPKSTPAPPPVPLPAAPAPAPAPAPSQPPTTAGLTLTVTEPPDNSIVNTDTIEIIGVTSPGAVISANNEFDTADDLGNFDISVALEEGPNVIEVVASDSSGNEESLTLTISYIKGG